MEKLTWRYRSNDALLLLWASRASTPAFSSNRLHEYQAVPVFTPRTHTHPAKFVFAVMWLRNEPTKSINKTWNWELYPYLQPPFFSIVLWQCEHSFVFDLIQFAVSLSSLHFLSHILVTAQITGRWSLSIGQPKQNLCSFPCKPSPSCWLLVTSCVSEPIPRAPQDTLGTMVTRLDFEAAEGHETVLVHEGYGQNFRFLLQPT